MDQGKSAGFAQQSRRVRPGLIALVVALHIAAIYGLARVFAPELTAGVERQVLSTITVQVTAPPEDPPQAEREAGASGEAGDKAKARSQSAAPPRLRPRDEAAPKVASSGSENRSGASSGEGTGARGEGLGSGSGAGGSGSGGGIATRPSVASGELNEARDFPVPPGGRITRIGKSVTVVFTVTRDGRAKDCRIAKSNVDAATAARVCPLVIEKIRFNPARNFAGEPVEARYGYRVDFKARD